MMDFLPGVPADYVRARLEAAAGQELASGKLESPESSAALVVNCFAWFHDKPRLLPPFPGVSLGFPPHQVDVEFSARFPWRGGTHPWLDAFAETASHVIGVESKRYEPYRDEKKVDFSDAYDRPVWGTQMSPFEAMRDELRSGALRYQMLDAAQLVKHAFGLVTEATKRAKRAKRACLVYLFAEPEFLKGRRISPAQFSQHRAEVADFEQRTRGAGVAFTACAYREWLAHWPEHDVALSAHKQAVLERFSP